MTTKVKSIEDLTPLLGTHLGYSAYLTVTQEQVNLFADATGDHQWIHVDPVKAAAGPFGRTVAHGYLTLSLLPVLLASVIRVGFGHTRRGGEHGCQLRHQQSPLHQSGAGWL
jgi:acyl dehydratase